MRPFRLPRSARNRAALAVTVGVVALLAILTPALGQRSQGRPAGEPGTSRAAARSDTPAGPSSAVSRDDGASVPTPVRITIQHASAERSNPRRAQKRFVEAAFDRGGNVITFTEVGSKENKHVQPLLKAAAKAHGYRLFLPGGYGEALAVRFPGSTVLGSDFAGPILPSAPGRYPSRGVRWVTIRHPTLGVLTFGVYHANAHDISDRGVRAVNKRLSEGVVDWVDAKASDGRLVWVDADTNVNDATDGHQGTSTWPLTRAGLVSTWDEAGTYPGTLGGRTVDRILRLRNARVTLLETRVYPLAGSDHRAISATYAVAPKS